MALILSICCESEPTAAHIGNAKIKNTKDNRLCFIVTIITTPKGVRFLLQTYEKLIKSTSNFLKKHISQCKREKNKADILLRKSAQQSYSEK
jgi:hypothetical protein